MPSRRRRALDAAKRSRARNDGVTVTDQAMTDEVEVAVRRILRDLDPASLDDATLAIGPALRVMSPKVGRRAHEPDFLADMDHRQVHVLVMREGVEPAVVGVMVGEGMAPRAVSLARNAISSLQARAVALVDARMPGLVSDVLDIPHLGSRALWVRTDPPTFVPLVDGYAPTGAEGSPRFEPGYLSRIAAQP